MKCSDNTICGTLNVSATTSIPFDLYRNQAEKKKVDKTNDLSHVRTIYGTFREGCNILNPVIRIKGELPDFNYVYIRDYHRFYFVTDITNERKGLWAVSLRVDVLMSYKDEIAVQKAFVTRNENRYNDLLADTARPSLVTFDFDTIQAKGAVDKFELNYPDIEDGLRYIVIHNQKGYGQ